MARHGDRQNNSLAEDLRRPSWWVERVIWLVAVVATISYQLAQYPDRDDVQKMIDQSLKSSKFVSRDDVQKMIDQSLEVANMYLKRADAREASMQDILLGLHSEIARHAKAVEQLEEQVRMLRR